MRELRQAVLHVQHTAAADDAVPVCVIRLPEGGLVDPIGLLLDPLAEAESLKHLHRAASHAVGLAELQWAGLLLDNAGADVREHRKLGSECQSGRSAADDQH